jgi:hypothetical protein
MDTGRIKKWVEQQSADTAEWSVKGTPDAEETSELEPSGMNTTTEPGDGVVQVTSTLGCLVRDKLLLVAKPFYPHLLEHPGPEGHLIMSSLDNILDGEETLTWVEQHEITATVGDDR